MSKSSGAIFPVILNQSNVIPSSSNNILRYNFPGSATFTKAKLAISNIQIYYSWFNISAAYNNNKFSLVIPTAATTTTINITVPNGSYNLADLNAYIQSQLIANNIGYLVDNNGNYVYYLELVENAVNYSIQYNSYVIPTTLQTGWTNPASWVLPSSTSNTPQIIIPNTNIVSLLGFNAGTYPPTAQSTNYSKLSDNVPQLSPVSSVLVGCGLVSNPLSNPQNIVYSFSSGGVAYGNLIQSNAYEYSWISIQPGTYSSIDIIFYDQNYNALNIVDTNIIVFLLIKFEE